MSETQKDQIHTGAQDAIDFYDKIKSDENIKDPIEKASLRAWNEQLLKLESTCKLEKAQVKDTTCQLLDELKGILTGNPSKPEQGMPLPKKNAEDPRIAVWESRMKQFRESNMAPHDKKRETKKLQGLIDGVNGVMTNSETANNIQATSQNIQIEGVSNEDNKKILELTNKLNKSGEMQPWELKEIGIHLQHLIYTNNIGVESLPMSTIQALNNFHQKAFLLTLDLSESEDERHLTADYTEFYKKYAHKLGKSPRHYENLRLQAVKTKVYEYQNKLTSLLGVMGNSDKYEVLDLGRKIMHMVEENGIALLSLPKSTVNALNCYHVVELGYSDSYNDINMSFVLKEIREYRIQTRQTEKQFLKSLDNSFNHYKKLAGFTTD